MDVICGESEGESESVKATGGGPRSKKHFLPVGRARTI